MCSGLSGHETAILSYAKACSNNILSLVILEQHSTYIVKCSTIKEKRLRLLHMYSVVVRMFF